MTMERRTYAGHDIPLVAASKPPVIGETGRRRWRSDIAYVANDFLIIWDVLCIGLSGFVCALFYKNILGSTQVSSGFIVDAGRMVVVAAIFAPFVLSDRQYRQSVGQMAMSELIIKTSRRVAVLAGFLLAIGFLSRVLGSVPRLWVVMWGCTSFATTVGGRLFLNRSFREMRTGGLLSDRIAVVGGGPASNQLLEYLGKERGRGINVVATFNDILEAGDAAFDQSLAQLIAMGQRNEIDRVILTLPLSEEARVFEIVYRLKVLDVEVAHCPSWMNAKGTVPQITQVAGVPLIVLTNRPMERRGRLIKAIEDLVLAGLLVVLVAPLLALIAIAIRCDSPGPLIFRQRRHGWNGTEFLVFKFRTMHWQSSGSGEVQTKRKDARVTRLGRLLRTTSLDELPQLFNVLNGTMSLVGPRPHPVVMRTEQQLGEEIIAEYSHRHRVKPGITGWAQINGHRGATETAEQVRKRVECDIFYIDNWSPFFDLKILLLTPFKILFQRTNAF